jgi:hypothetical protein
VIAISDRTRSLLYVTSAAMLVVWSAGTASLARGIAAEPSAPAEIRAAARGYFPGAGADPEPTLPPVRRDPFAPRIPVVVATAAPVALVRAAGLKDAKGLRVPDIDGAAGAAAPEAPVLRGIISASSSAGALAIVDGGHGTQFVHAGDQLGGRTIATISANGILFSDGSRIGLAPAR